MSGDGPQLGRISEKLVRLAESDGPFHVGIVARRFGPEVWKLAPRLEARGYLIQIKRNIYARGDRELEES